MELFVWFMVSIIFIMVMAILIVIGFFCRWKLEVRQIEKEERQIEKEDNQKRLLEVL